MYPGIAEVYSIGRHDGLVLGTVYKYVGAQEYAYDMGLLHNGYTVN
jgi:hypothetical protein